MISIIPAIDIIDGKCVRLQQGDYSRSTVYSDNPLEMARRFEDAGLKRLHLVDLDGARSGEVQNGKTLESIASKTKLIVDFSGGLRKRESIRTCFDAGAAYCAVGSTAVLQPLELSNWITEFGHDKFIIGADVKDDLVQIRGWTEATTLSVFDLITQYRAAGIRQFFCTDISKDGLLTGSAESLYQRILQQFPDILLIASGGISSLEEIERLNEAGCDGAIVGKALYENKITLTEIQNWLAKNVD